MTPPAWRVTIEEHKVGIRWRLERQVRTAYAANEKFAKMHAIRAAHVAAEIPPLRSLLRSSWHHTTVEPVEKIAT